jgi:CubicO group peptidase (beta-lactamase class C family)
VSTITHPRRCRWSVSFCARRVVVTAVAATATAGLAAVGVLTPSAPDAKATMRGPADAVQQRLDSLVHADGFPGAVATVRSSDGTTRTYTAGVSNLATHAPMPVDGRVRIGSNTNYILAGLLVQRVTGRPIGEEITNRVIRRAGLRDTYWAVAGDQQIRGSHPHGYWKTTPDGEATDVTVQDPSAGWAAGQLIGTPADLIRFFRALIGGRLLAPEQLKQMQTTVNAPTFDHIGGARYGLGLATFRLSCGGFAWAHGGDIPGYETRNAVTTDGRAATIAVTALPTTLAAARNVEKALDTALCG